MYTFMKKEFKNEKDAVIAWSESEDRRFYSVFFNNMKMNICKIESKDKLKEIIKGMNNMEVHFPNSNKSYIYRSFDKIDFNKIDYVTFSETRGINRNLVSWLRVYCINGELIGVC